MQRPNSKPEYWHCRVKVPGDKSYAVINDLNFDEIKRIIVEPWNAGHTFAVSGTLVNPAAGVSEIQIVHTDRPQRYYADDHDARMEASGIADLATDRRLLPFSAGTDATFDLLFSGGNRRAPEPDTELVATVCKRLPQTARILSVRSRKRKAAFDIKDEYDVQDLLHAVLRAYIKYSVQEDPLGKVAGAKAGRADISIEKLGVLIEIKYVRGPEDQRRIFEELSQDLLLYAGWPHLKTLLFVIYNSADLREPEAFEKLSAPHEISGHRFDVQVVLA